MKVPENNTNLKEERDKMNKEFLITLCNDVCKLNLTEAEVEKGQRLGTKVENKDRTLLIRFENTDIKKDLFKNLSSLKNSEEPYSKIQIIHDLTPREREEYRKLREEANAKSTEKEKFVVRGPPWARKIVKLQATGGTKTTEKAE